ncbi:hypothetical protein [Sphingomonas sp. LM7]|uniref:hypothetical protein n=1 Tax=Sphingomonas sp. LM7 TaxID=1938607 RepID=UPI000983ED74|nr:hypothetical protein [Sphingomonas sp. LM7]AQR72866.1 hypothetical protein BXU08_03510 [Sphingomonas sp. LM7]
MKSVVSGVAGSVRLAQLTRAGLTRAEKHGKRLDAAGQGRAINDRSALTRTGLDLNALFDAHVQGAFIPEAKTKAMHLIFQFPKELVDPEDAAGMLHHARAYAERVFGADAVFADRIDRDEKNTQVVDLFIAPKYVKRTKRSEKISVSMTRHLKQLAEKHGHPPIPPGIGRAMQDELFEYFRDVMKLDGVERGARKAYPGPDWKSAEQQRLEELEELQRGLDERAAAQDAREARQEDLDRDLAAREARLNTRENKLGADEAAVQENRATVLREQGQTNLLLRALEDDGSLELAIQKSGRPRMNEEAMNDDERFAYRLIWTERMMELARFVADVLWAVRKKIAELAKRESAARDRERVIDERERVIANKETEIANKQTALSARDAILRNNEELFDNNEELFFKKATLLQRTLDQAMRFRSAWDPIPESERAPAVNMALKAAEGLTAEDLPPGFILPGRGGASRG